MHTKPNLQAIVAEAKRKGYFTTGLWRIFPIKCIIALTETEAVDSALV